MGKSKNRQVLSKIFSNSFVDEDDKKYVTHVDYAWEDSLTRFHDFDYDNRRQPTGQEILNYMMKRAMSYLDDTCKVYVLNFDKTEYVPKMKGVIHKKRAESNRVLVCPDPQPGEKLLTWGKKSLYGWSSMLANRNARRQLIEEFTMLVRDHFCPPDGKMLIIDGGFQDNTKGPLVILSEAIADDDHGSSSCEITPQTGNPYKKVVYAENLINTLGQG